MPYVRLAGVLLDVERCESAIFDSAGKHDLMDASFKKDIYGTKTRWRVGRDYWTLADYDTLRGLFLSHNPSIGFIDLEGGAYQVVFEDDEFSLSPRVDIPWENRRYTGDFTLRQV